MSVFDRFDPLTKEYLTELRSKGILHFEEDPVVDVFKMRENVYSIYSRSPGAGGDAWMHLVIGPEKAMLIDTGFGIGDLKALVEKLTDQPYYVVNTHFHGDHSQGNYQFEEVYCQKYDVEGLMAQMNPEVRERFQPKEDSYYTAADVVPYKEYKVIGVEDGYVFNLGQGHTIELIHLPGHAPGGCGFIDPVNRILFSGDAVVSTPVLICGDASSNPHSEFMTVAAFGTQLEKLTAKLDQFDVLYPGHAILEYPKSSVTDMLQACREVVADPDSFTEINSTGRIEEAKLKIVGLASFAYTDDRVR